MSSINWKPAVLAPKDQRFLALAHVDTSPVEPPMLVILKWCDTYQCFWLDPTEASHFDPERWVVVKWRWLPDV